MEINKVKSLFSGKTKLTTSCRLIMNKRERECNKTFIRGGCAGTTKI